MDPRKTALALIGGLAFGVLPASAEVVSFNFAGANGNLGPAESFTQGAFTVNVFGLTYARFGEPAGTWVAADIVRVGNALGIDNSAVDDGAGLDDSTPQLDNRGYYDLLIFELPVGTGPRRIRFDEMDSDDDWRVGWNDSLFDFSLLDPFGLFGALDGFATGDSGSYSFGALDTSKSYLFVGGKNRVAEDGNDDFYVDKVKIEGVLREQNDPVPEPASLVLLGSGLLMGGLARRRRRQ